MTIQIPEYVLSCLPIGSLLLAVLWFIGRRGVHASAAILLLLLGVSAMALCAVAFAVKLFNVGELCADAQNWIVGGLLAGTGSVVVAMLSHVVAPRKVHEESEVL